MAEDQWSILSAAFPVDKILALKASRQEVKQVNCRGYIFLFIHKSKRQQACMHNQYSQASEDAKMLQALTMKALYDIAPAIANSIYTPEEAAVAQAKITAAGDLDEDAYKACIRLMKFCNWFDQLRMVPHTFASCVHARIVCA